MASLKTLDGTAESNQRKDGDHDDDGINAGALPVTAAQVQPHSKLVEGEGHGHAVQNGGDIGREPHRTAEQRVPADPSQQKDAVVQVMDVRIVEEEVEIGNEPAMMRNTTARAATKVSTKLNKARRASR